MKPLILAAALLIITAPAKAETVVRIGYIRVSDGLNLARLRGTMEPALVPLGVRIEWAGPFAAFAPIAEALNGNSVDIGTGSSSSALTAISGDAPVSLFAMVPANGDDSGLLVLQDAPFKTLQDLVGKKIAVNRAGTGEYLLSRALAHAKMPADSVKRVYMAPNDSIGALVQHDVDAWSAWGTSYPIAQVQFGARILSKAGDFGSENAVVYLARTDYAKNNPMVIGTILHTLQAAERWYDTHQAEAAKLWVNDLHVSQEVATIIANYPHGVSAPIKEPQLVSLGHQNDWLVEQHVLRQPANISQHVITNFGGVPVE
jgi:sulfonate transport system substrate-binding protein